MWRCTSEGGASRATVVTLPLGACVKHRARCAAAASSLLQCCITSKSRGGQVCAAATPLCTIQLLCKRLLVSMAASWESQGSNDRWEEHHLPATLAP